MSNETTKNYGKSIRSKLLNISKEENVRWKSFLNKITKGEKLTFSDVVKYIQNVLRPYWENLANE